MGCCQQAQIKGTKESTTQGSDDRQTRFLFVPKKFPLVLVFDGHTYWSHARAGVPVWNLEQATPPVSPCLVTGASWMQRCGQVTLVWSTPVHHNVYRIGSFRHEY